MISPIKQPDTPASVVVVGTGIAVLVGLVVLKMVIGFVITLASLVIGAALITAVVISVSRMLGKDD